MLDKKYRASKVGRGRGDVGQREEWDKGGGGMWVLQGSQKRRSCETSRRKVWLK